MNYASRMLVAGLIVIACAGALTAATIHVDAVNGSDDNDGSTPETALKTLQMAVDYSFDGDEVIAAPGVYDEGGRAESDYDTWSDDALMNRVHIPHALTLRSSAGPDQTFIVGQPGSGEDGLGPDAVRCVLATAWGTVIEGFTITNGHTSAYGWNDDSMGGGIRCGWDGVTVANCILSGNAAYYGGGTYNGRILSCRFEGNRAVENGGGAQNGEFECCLFVENVAGNHGGAVADAYLLHCTAVGNRAGKGGGGTAWTDFNNSIVYFNTAPRNANYQWGWGFEGSCTFPKPDTGENVLTIEPRFADTNGWSDLRLTIQSLCIDTGSDWYPTTADVDLDGNPRVSGMLPDMGAYEWQGDVLPVVSFVEPEETVSEDAGTLVIGVMLSEPMPEDLTLVLTYGGSATTLADYINAPPTVTFPAGMTDTTVDLLVLDDTLPEYPETIVIALAPNNAFRYGYAQYTVNILDNDGMPEVTRFLLAGGAAGIDTNFVDYIDLEVLNEPEEYLISESADFAGASWIAPGEDDPIVFTLSGGYGEKTVWFKIRKSDGAGGYLVSLPVSDSIYYGPPLAVAVDQPGAAVYSDGDNGQAWYGVVDAAAQGGSLAQSPPPLPGLDWVYSWIDLAITLESPMSLGFTAEQFGNGNMGFLIGDEWQNLDDIWLSGPHAYSFELDAGTHALRWTADLWNAVASDYCTLDAVTFTPLPPRVWFASDFASAREGDTLEIGVQLEWALEQPLTVNYSMNGSATYAADYTVSGVPGEVVIPAGATQAVFTVTVVDDTDPEHSESVDFRIDDGAGYRVGQPDQQTVLIFANDGLIDFLELWLEGGAAETTNRVIRVDGAATALPTHLMVSEDPDFTGAEWIAFTTNAPMTFALSEGFGQKTVYAKVRIPKTGGGWEESNVLTATIQFLACTLSSALDTDLAVTTTDSYPWFGQTNVTHDGVDAARSAELPPISQYAYSYMNTEIEGPVIVSFWWKISGYNSSSYYFSSLNFLVNQSIVETIYGFQDWTRVSITLPAGTHSLQWRYDQNWYYGHDNCGWVDQLTITPDWPEVTFSTPGQNVNEADGTIFVQVQMNRQEANAVTVPFQVSGSATPGADFTFSPEFSVTFPPYETVQTIAVNLLDDAVPEATETARFTLVPTHGVLVGLANTHDLIILPNDGTPIVTLFEQQGGSVNVTNRDIVLSVAASGDPAEYRLSENPAFGDAAWCPFTATPAFTLSPGYGEKTLWIQVRVIIDGYGWILSDPVSLALQAQPSLAEAMNVVGGQVASPSDSPWFGQLAVSRDGAAAQSGPIAHYGQSTCVLSLTGEGTVGFWWKVSSEGGYDYLSLYADGVFISSISGTGGDWQYVTHTFTGLGAHTLEWRYTKDGSVSSGSDCGWVDQVDLSGWTHTQVALPQFSPPSNTLFNVTLEVTITSATLGAQIHYTLDGSDPDETSALYTNALVLTETTTIKARGYLAGAPASDLAAATYIRSNATPGFDPPSGTSFINSLDVAITSAVAGVTLYYTLDGSAPDTNSAVYAAPITLTDTTVIKAAAYDGDTPVSTVSSATYTLQPADAPAFSPGDGLLFDGTLDVTLTCGTAGAAIRYTLDGSEPTAESALYTSARTLSNAMTVVRARAFKAGMAPSTIASATYFRRGGIMIWGYNGYGQCNVPANLTDAAAFALGYYHGLALRSNGTVVAWGYNGNGQCSVPEGLPRVAAVAAGANHSLALLANGHVAAWGYNGYGQCNVPDSLDRVVSVAAGTYHSLALQADGRVVAWGNNGNGQCSVPAGLSNVVAVAGGNNHSVALCADGTVVAWGYNGYGQCNVPAGLDAVAVAAGYYHSVALRRDGTLVAWGNDWSGQSTVPAGLSNVVTVAAGHYHTAAQRSDGTVAVFGENAYGQSDVPPGLRHVAALQAAGYNTGVQVGDWMPVVATPPSGTWIPPGDGSLTVRLASAAPGTIRYTLDGSDPTAASPVCDGHVILAQAAVLKAALFQGNERVGAIRSSTYSKQVAPPVFTPASGTQFIPDGGTLAVSLACATPGAEIRYTLDGGEPTSASGLYTAPLQLEQAASIRARAFKAGLAPSDSVMGLYARVGDFRTSGNNSYGQTTLPAPLPADIRQTAVARLNGAFVLAGGTVQMWGYNGYGLLTPPADLTNALAIALGYNHVIALRASGTVSAWGNNGNGQCNVPAGLLDVVAIAAGDYNSLALRADGSVAVWGYEGYELNTPPADLTNAVAVSLSHNHALAVRADGTVAAWGNNWYGQCDVPVGSTGVVAVVGGYNHSLALTAGGQVMAWGDNGSGQCMVPAGLSNVVAIAVGEEHSVALTAEGRVFAWGDNSYGQRDIPPGLPPVAAISAAGYSTLLRYGIPVPVAFTPPSGMLVPGSGYPFPVRLHGVTLGGAIRYTIDGSAPTDASPVYDAPILLGDATTVRAALVVGGAQVGGAAAAFFPLLPGGVVFNTVAVDATPAGAGFATGGGLVRKFGAVTVTATVTDTERYAFARWLRNGVAVSTLPVYTFTVTENCMMTAVFELRTFPVTVTIAPAGLGWVSGAGWWSHGVSNTLRAYPYSGCEFLGWEDTATGTPLGSALTYTTAVTAPLGVIARFKELVTTHTVTTRSEPPGLAVIAGAGVYPNGQLATFTAPAAVTNGEMRQVFSHFTRNGNWASASNPWNWWMSRTDPETVEVAAVYIAQPLAPKVRRVNSNLTTPVPITDNMQVSVVFDRPMNPAIAPAVSISNRLSAAVKTLPAGGSWSGGYVNGDTYRCPPVSFGRGEDGDCDLRVAGARDTFGGILAPTNAWSFRVDATPPHLPTLRLTQSNDTWFTVGWADYAPPADLNGFRIYVSESFFTNLASVSPTTYSWSGARAYTRYNIQLDTTYWIAVAPMDQAGNAERIVNPLAVRIPRALPPPVALTVTPAGADSARLDWTGYPGNSFGFAGFRVYRETTPFANVSNLTPIATLGKTVRSQTVGGLDRTVTNWFAVVGFNTRDEMIPEVEAQPWRDPFQGLITQNTTIGAPGTVTEILGPLMVAGGATLTVPAGATLAFRPGAGITVETGALVANGTALKPIRFTGTNNDQGTALQAGAWSGVTLGAQAGASILRHVWIDYGRGLTVAGCAPTVEACSAHYNAPAALHVQTGGRVNTVDALLLYNGVGLLADPGATLTVTRSIVRNNQTNACALAGAAITATDVWWGAAEPATVASNLFGAVAHLPVLPAEPLLTPAADAADGNRNVGVPQVTLALAARVAEAMQISEDSSFAGAFFDAYESPHTVALSAGGGVKTLYIRFRNSAGQIGSTVALPINYITGGPQVIGANIQEGSVLRRPFRVTANAVSGLGVSVLRLLVDDTLVASTNGQPSLSAWWDIRSLADGTHRVRIEAEDSQGRLGVSAFNVRVAIDPPPNPVLSAPVNGLLTVEPSVGAAGTAEPFMPVVLRRNGAAVVTVNASAAGAFAASLPLVEGENRIVATVADAFGTGRSAERTVVLDSGAPAAPTLQSNGYRQGTGLQLAWLHPESGEVPFEYRVVYGPVPFATAGVASNTTGWIRDTQTNLKPASDGRWYFAVEGRDLADNRSPLSNILTNDYDATPPAFTIVFDKPSPAGTGPLTATIEATETLAAKPTVIVHTPAGTGPTMLSVIETAPSRYACVFNVQASAGTGMLNYRVSGTDLAGNQTLAAAPTGPAMAIDTRGPGARLAATPSGLIQVTNLLPMQVTLTLDEAPAAAPLLRFAPPESAVLAVALTGSGTNWFGTIELLPSMGSGIATFLYTADDPLGNTGTQLHGVTQVELFNTALPSPPPRVTDLRASVSLPTGIVQLVWLPVAEAESYTLRRQRGYAGSDPDAILAEGIAGSGYVDLPAEDDFYRYTVTATRRGAQAQPSPVALGLSDRTPPPAPTNLTAALANTGVRVAWEYAVSGEQAANFRVWRNGVVLRNNVAPAVREIVDNPARGGWTYGVSALDLSGNEIFAVSNATINLELPAPQRADATVGLSGAPVLTWQTRAEHVGVNLYRNGVRLNATPLTGGSFTDSQLAGTTRTLYEVRGVDAQGRESASRLLPVLHAAFGLTINPAAGGAALTRYFDVAEIIVSNRTTDAALELAGVTVARTSAGTGATTERTVSIETAAAARGTARIPVVLPCAVAIAEQTYTLRITQALDDPSASVVYERVIVRPAPVPPALTIELSTTNQPLAGAGCVYQARVHNRGQEAIDLVMWRDATPGDLSIRVLDAAGVVVNRKDAMMPAAALNRSGDGHRGFLTILPGSSVLINMPEIVIPEALGGAGQAAIEVVAQRIYWHCGESDELLSGPLQGRVTITPTLTPYTAFGLPERSLYVAGETLVVTGYAFDRVSGARATNVPVHVGLALGEYIWFSEAQSDAAGDFRAEWPIAAGVSGWFDIWAAHPGVKDRLNHGRAAIHQVYFSPNAADLRSAANNVLTVSLNVYNPGEFAYSNLTSVFTAWRMEGTNPVPLAGSVVTGWVDQAETLTIGAFRKTPVALKLAPTEDAPARLMARFEIVTGEGLRIPFDVNVSVSQPLPLLQVTVPAAGYVDMSLDRGKMRSTDVEIRNDGFKPLLGVRMTPPQSVPWMQVALTPEPDGSFKLPDLAPGARHTFQVVYAPGEDVAMNYYSDTLVIAGTNSAVAKTINLYAKIASDQRGTLAFAVRNTLNQAVPDAAIRLRSALDGSERSGIRTDANGEIEIPELMEGRWHWLISASGHGTQAGTATIEANSLVETAVVLNCELVTVSFTVVPVPFTDRYTIKIEQTFATHVPAPVLVVDPVFMKYDKVLPGFEATFTATAKNYGLIKLENFTVNGANKPRAQMIPAVTYLPELAPMQQVEIPFKVAYFGAGGAASTPMQAHAPTPPAEMAMSAEDGAPVMGALSKRKSNDPCDEDDFLDALQNLMGMLAGRYGCIDGTTLANAMMMVQVLLALQEEFGDDTSEIIKAIDCFLKDMIGTSEDRATQNGSDHSTWKGLGDYNGCFAAGTAVRLADGSNKPIESIRDGDVLATGSGPRDRARVLAAFVRDEARLREISLEGGRMLRLTDEHLVWVDGAGWRQAQHVKPGEQLAVWPDVSEPVLGNVSAAARATVYTLELREETTFFAEGVLVQHLCGAQVPGMRRTDGGPPLDPPVQPTRKEVSHE